MSPVIRIDDEVWRELQKQAEAFIDSPNSVLRKLLNLDTIEVNSDDGYVEIVLNNLHSPRNFAVIPVPKQKRNFFPGYKIFFDLETDVGIIRTRMTSAPKGTPIGDPAGGAYIQGNLRQWWDRHPELKPGLKFCFEVIKPGGKYRLSTQQLKP